MRLAQLGHHHAVREEGRGRQRQDRRVDDEGDVQRQRRVEQVVADRLALARRRGLDAPRLHQRGMQVQVVRHHRRPEDAHRHQQAGGVQPRHEAAGHVAPHRPRQHQFDRHAGADGQHQHRHDRLQFSHTVVLQRQDQHHVQARDQRAPGQRQAEQQVQGDRAAEQFGQVAGDDRHFAQQPQRHRHRPGVVGAAGLRQVDAPGDAEPRGQALQHHRDQVRCQQHPHQLVAEARAAFEVGGPVARVHVADADHRRRPGEAEHAPAPGRVHAPRHMQPHVDRVLQVRHRRGPARRVNAAPATSLR